MKSYYKSPIGYVLIEEMDGAIHSVTIADDVPPDIQRGDESEIMTQCITQLDEYFKGERRVFDIALRMEGTPFRRSVWEALLQVPYGQTCSYRDIAGQIGNPQAVRAVGGANHHNPIWLIVPCHRVIGANGRLVGYGGGLWRKEWLLMHELKHEALFALSK